MAIFSLVVIPKKSSSGVTVDIGNQKNSSCFKLVKSEFYCLSAQMIDLLATLVVAYRYISKTM